jgi:hypothetical protein
MIFGTFDMSHPNPTSYLDVFVPAADKALLAYIPSGAGIVGAPEDGKVRIHFECNDHTRPSLLRYANRVFKAARKLVEGRDQESSLVTTTELVQVGRWNDDQYAVDLYTPNSAALAAWLGRESIHETDDELIYDHQ